MQSDVLRFSVGRASVVAPTVEAFHTAIRKLVAERLAASGKPWEEVVHDPDFEFTREEFEKVEADLLATGYRFDISAVVSLQEEPDKYKTLGRLRAGRQRRDRRKEKPAGGSSLRWVAIFSAGGRHRDRAFRPGR